jgi:hypothetical protein
MKIRGLLAGVFVVGALAPVAVTPQPACAAESPRAVLVVDTGSSVQRLCVALPDDDVSGLELIAAAGNQHGLDYAFGYGGQGVCRLAGVGSASEECFEDDYPNFWGYWRGNGSGGWTWSSTGAGNTAVNDGDVEGWAWGEGTGPQTHPAPPATTFGSACLPETGDRPRPPGGAGGGERDGAAAPARGGDGDPSTSERVSTAVATTGDARAGSADKAEKKAGRKKARKDEGRDPAQPSVRVDPMPVAGPEPDGPAPTTPTADSGPPPAGVAALVAALLLAALGAVVLKRRRHEVS